MEKIAVVVTVLNEQDTIENLISSLKNQALKPAEIVVIDGGSTDATISKLQKMSLNWNVLRVYQRPGNRSHGRNHGVAKTKSPLIAFTDAGCIPEPTWLRELIKPFSNSNTQIVSGYYKGHAESSFQLCLTPYVLVMPDKVGTEFLPSTRSMALRRKIWNRTQGFDENLSHNEDYAFAHTLKKMGFNFTFAPKAVVSWIPRLNIKQAAIMFTRFALGDYESGILRPKVKVIFLRYMLFLYLIFLFLEMPNLGPLILAVCASYIVWAIVKNYKYVRQPQALFWLPVLQLTSDFSVLVGTTIGYINRAISK